MRSLLNQTKSCTFETGFCVFNLNHEIQQKQALDDLERRETSSFACSEDNPPIKFLVFLSLHFYGTDRSLRSKWMGFHGSFMSILRNYQIKLGRSNVTTRFGMPKLLMPITFRLRSPHDDKHHKDIHDEQNVWTFVSGNQQKVHNCLASRNNTTTLIRIFKRKAFACLLGKVTVFSNCTTHEIKLKASGKEYGLLIVDVIKRRGCIWGLCQLNIILKLLWGFFYFKCLRTNERRLSLPK